MSHCHSCGGVIGRDCWNPQECAEITERMAIEQRQPDPAPSNANTSGLGDAGLSETYRFAYESIRNGAPGLSDATCAAIARSINMKVSLAANDRATAAEARADRLAERLRADPTPEQLEPFARKWCIDNGIDPDAPKAPHGEWPEWYDACGPFAAMWRDLAQAALQQETQP